MLTQALFWLCCEDRDYDPSGGQHWPEVLGQERGHSPSHLGHYSLVLCQRDQDAGCGACGYQTVEAWSELEPRVTQEHLPSAGAPGEELEAFLGWSCSLTSIRAGELPCVGALCSQPEWVSRLAALAEGSFTSSWPVRVSQTQAEERQRTCSAECWVPETASDPQHHRSKTASQRQRLGLRGWVR